MIKTKLLLGFLCFFPFLPARSTNVVNQLGEGSMTTLIVLSFVFAVLLILIASKKALTFLGKNEHSILGKVENVGILIIYLIFIQALLLYPLFNCVYDNIDELIIRNTGKEFTAQFDQYNFNFVTEFGRAMSVTQGECTFDPVESVTSVPVRYDLDSMKLVVDMEKYTLRNWSWILFSSLLFFLNILLCFGLFNSFLQKQFGRWGKNARHDEVISFQWPSRNKKYESFTQFMNEVEHWNYEWGLDRKWIKTYETPRILMRFDEQLNGRPVKLEIEVIPDNGSTIRTDEWMFKLQNGIVPYLDILEDHTSPHLIIPKKWKPGKEMICKLFLGVYEEDSDYVITDVAWKFTDVAYTDYHDFIKEVQAFQTEHNKPLWNPDRPFLEQALFTLNYNDVRTKQDELVLMKADNGIGFTEGEILFKLHNLMINILPGQEFCYFRYLVLRRDGGEFDGDENCIYDLFTNNEL